MLILAGVSIATLVGENGILTQADKAKRDTQIAEEKEQIGLAWTGAIIQNEGGEVTAEDLNDQFTINGVDAEASGSNPIKVVFNETQREYTVDSDGNITGPTDTISVNKFGFYYNKLYKGTFNGETIGYIMNEDKTVYVFSDFSLGGELFYSTTITGGVNYENGKITITQADGSELIGIVQNDGNTLEGHMGEYVIMLELVPDELHGIYIGKTYEAIVPFEGEQVTGQIMFKTNGSGTMLLTANATGESIQQNITYEITANGYNINVLIEGNPEYIQGNVAIDGKSIYINGIIFEMKESGGIVDEEVSNPYDENGWVTAWIYSRDTETWTEVAQGGTATGDIVGKLYAVECSTNHKPLSLEDIEYEFTPGQEYNLVIEGKGEMPDFEANKTAWQHNTLIGNVFFEGANMNSAYITEVYICDGITNISSSAFYQFNSLKKVNIPSSVTKIGDKAFNNNVSLTNIVIPERVTNIGDLTFTMCVNLQSINIPKGVTSIGTQQFARCTNLQNITLPEGVKSIGESAFNGCTNLKSINIPIGVTSIGTRAFEDCSNLEGNITIPTGVTTISEWTFAYCSKLSEIILHNNITSIGVGAFMGCSGLSNISIPTGITTINTNTFANCTELTNVNIPANVTVIDSSAFENCSKLKTVTINGNITEVDTNAFKGMAQGSYIYVLNPTIQGMFDEFNYDSTTTTVKIIGT